MFTEQGKVVAIDSDRLWVEVVRHTACGGCAAKSDCGTGLIDSGFLALFCCLLSAKSAPSFLPTQLRSLTQLL